MAGEFIMVNPRHRKRNRRKKRTHRRKRSRARVAVSINPRRRHNRRRHRINARRHHRRHSNPRGGLGKAMNVVVPMAFVGGGFALNKWGTGFLLGFLPAEWQKDPMTSNLVRIGVKTGLTVTLPMVLKGVIGSTNAKWLALGLGGAVVYDLLQTFVPQLGLSDYEPVATSMSGYEAARLGEEGSDEELGAGENMYADTMYGY